MREPIHQFGELEAPIEAILERGKGPEHVPLLHRLERSDDGRGDVAENGIGPAETREVFRSAELSRNHRLVNAPHARHRTEAA
jgi:hypothetical protein